MKQKTPLINTRFAVGGVYQPPGSISY